VVNELDQIDLAKQADAAWDAGRFALAHGLYRQLAAAAPGSVRTEGERRMQQYAEGVHLAERACDALRYEQDVRSAKRWVAKARQALPGYSRIEPIQKEVSRWEDQFLQLESALAALNYPMVTSAAREIATAFPQNTTARGALLLLDHDTKLKAAIHTMARVHDSLDDLLNKAKLAAEGGEANAANAEIALQHLQREAPHVVEALACTAELSPALRDPKLTTIGYGRAMQPHFAEVNRLHNAIGDTLATLCECLAEAFVHSGAFEEARRVASREGNSLPESGYRGMKALFAAYRCEVPLAPKELAQCHNERRCALDQLIAKQEGDATADAGTAESTPANSVAPTVLPLHTALLQHATDVETRVAALRAKFEGLMASRRWTHAASLADTAEKILPKIFDGLAGRLCTRQLRADQLHAQLHTATQRGNFKEVQRLLALPDTRKYLSATEWNSHHKAMTTKADAKHQAAWAVGTLIGVLLLLGLMALTIHLRTIGTL